MARKGGTGSLLSLELDGEGESPLFQRLYRQLRQGVLEGRVRPGARLPATRFGGVGARGSRAKRDLLLHHGRAECYAIFLSRGEAA